MIIIGFILLYFFLGGLVGEGVRQFYYPKDEFLENPGPFFAAVLWPIALPWLFGQWLISPTKKKKEE